MDESARSAFEYALEHSEPFWAGRAAVRLAQHEARRGNWPGAAGFALESVERAPEFRDAWFWRGEALYRAGLYDRLIEFVEAMPAAESVPGSEAVTVDELRAERYLWDAVARWETNDDGTAAFVRAFTDVAAGPIHPRLYLYLLYRPGALEQFPSTDRTILDLVYRSANGERTEAARLLRTLDPAAVATIAAPGLWETMVDLVGPGERAWVDRLLTHVSDRSLTSVASGMALHMAARTDASRMNVLLSQAAESDVPAVRDRAVAAWLDDAIASQQPLPGVLSQLSGWDAEPDTLARAVDRLAPALVRDRDWETLAVARGVLPRAAHEAYAHLSFILDHAAAANLYRGGGDTTAPNLDARNLPPLNYFGMVSRALAGEEPIAQAANSASTPASDPASPSNPAANGNAGAPAASRDDVSGGNAVLSADMRHARALAHAGLGEAAWRIAMRAAQDPAIAREGLQVARDLSALGYVSEALDVGRRAAVRGEVVPADDEMTLLYPLAFRTEIEQAAIAHGVEPYIMLGLVREESHFRPGVASHVGATGLAQIMPATGADIRRQMDWPDAELTSPSDNARMGAWYLNYLAGRVPGTIFALAAYNAGQGRARGWAATFGDLPPILQVEAIPFIETRWYVRRIALSQAVYANILSGEPIAAAIRRFFGV